MTDRSASATIKGYFYQFDQTILRLLKASKTATVTVEGIEDIDLEDGNDSALVQCKYYEGTEYNHSVIKDAVILMLRHFHSLGCPKDQPYRYRLFGHYKKGQYKLAMPLADDLLKDSLLTYSKEKVQHKVYEELGITAAQLDAFRSALDININAPSYEKQQEEILQTLVTTIPGCTSEDAEFFYYPGAINIVQSLAVQTDEANRKITRDRFLEAVNRKEAVFSSWLQQKFGADYYAKLIRRKHFRFNHTKMPKASRFFVVDMSGDFVVHKAANMIAMLGEFFSHKEHSRTPQEDRFSPYVLLRGINPLELAALKEELWQSGVKFNDGYPFLGASFSPALLVSDPTKENLWRIKFISADDQLAKTISAITGSLVEIYDIFKTVPLDDTLVPKGKTICAIRCSSSYFIQEVMKT